MKTVIWLTLCLLVAACASTNNQSRSPNQPPSSTHLRNDSGRENDDAAAESGAASSSEVTRMHITVNAKRLSATLSQNATARALHALLPLRLEMRDLNENEKYAALPSSLPEDESIPGTILAGDIMLYGSNTLVLFYETFDTSYAYTRIGRIEVSAELRGALSPGDVSVTFEP